MTEEFQKTFRTQKLFPPGAKVLLAVSGGADSVVLCELFHRCGFAFVMAHCNFRLRGKESDGDEAFVKKLAAKYKTDFFSIRFDTLSYATAHKLSVQEAARDLRYAWFERMRRENHLQYIATAHHRNDSIETFFINLVRGTGPDGLKGIPLKKGKIIRPLLFATRKEIESFATVRNLRWRHDSSNDHDDYLRNRIRQELIPVFTRLQPSFEKIMQQNMLHLSEAVAAITEWARDKTEIAVQKTGKEALSIDLSVFEEKWAPLLVYTLLKERDLTGARLMT